MWLIWSGPGSDGVTDLATVAYPASQLRLLNWLTGGGWAGMYLLSIRRGLGPESRIRVFSHCFVCTPPDS
jgi:hypothetical protein